MNATHYRSLYHELGFPPRHKIKVCIVKEVMSKLLESLHTPLLCACLGMCFEHTIHVDI